jgi:hypothetical protein
VHFLVEVRKFGRWRFGRVCGRGCGAVNREERK